MHCRATLLGWCPKPLEYSSAKQIGAWVTHAQPPPIQHPGMYCNVNMECQVTAVTLGPPQIEMERPSQHTCTAPCASVVNISFSQSSSRLPGRCMDPVAAAAAPGGGTIANLIVAGIW
jgi:hypothetical protein